MTFECKKLRNAARGQSCVRCGKTEGVVGCHYTGVRRLAFGGGFGIKVHDFLIADLCQECHHYMDTLSRKKDGTAEYLHSEEFLYLIALTWERRVVHQGLFSVGGNRVAQAADPVELLASPVVVVLSEHDKAAPDAGAGDQP